VGEHFVDFMCRRVSYPKLTDPAPQQNVLNRIYRSALRAPDHKQLRPWRYRVIQGEARQTLGELFCSASLAQDENLAPAKIEKLRKMPLRAPMIIVGISKHIPHPKVPREEQVISCGVGMGYMLLALQAEGFGGIWRTGPLASDPLVRKGLGVDEDETLVGFLYLGTPDSRAKSIPDLDVDAYFSEWSAPE